MVKPTNRHQIRLRPLSAASAPLTNDAMKDGRSSPAQVFFSQAVRADVEVKPPQPRGWTDESGDTLRGRASVLLIQFFKNILNLQPAAGPAGSGAASI